MDTHARRVIAMLIAGSLLLAACGRPEEPGRIAAPDVIDPVATVAPPTESPITPPPEPTPELPVPMEPAAHFTPEEAARLARAVNAFGFDLFGALEGGTEENVTTSPLSVSVLVGMLAAGAGGDTYQAIVDTLHLDDAHLDESSYAALLAALGEGDEEVILQVANSLWAMEGIPFTEEYLSTTRDVFAAVAEELDLGSQEAVERIDAWVLEHTQGLIEEIASDLGLPDPQAVLVLLNAVYFFGPWQEPFDPRFTQQGPFTRPDGSRVSAQLMSRTDVFEHHRADGFEVLRLPYGQEGRFGMEVFLPDEGSSVAELAENLDAETWKQAIDQLTESPLMVRLPRFDLSYEASLDDALEELGMGVAYSRSADFSRMTPVGAWLSTVVHKTRVKVDEEGTEAAAVTGGVMASSMPPSFEADRPFLFTISDRETGTILFLGAVTDPTAE